MGDIRWRHDLGISEVSKPLLVSIDDVVVDLLTFAGASVGPAHAPEGHRGSSVVVLDTATGILRWRIDREADPDDLDPEDVASYSLSGDSLAGRMGADLVVWNARTGEIVWSVSHAGGVQPGGGAWIAGGRVLSASPAQTDTAHARLDASALSSGVERWSQQLPGDVAAAASTDEMSWVATWGRGESCS